MLTYKVSLSDKREKTKKWAEIRVPFSHENMHTQKRLQNHMDPMV